MYVGWQYVWGELCGSSSWDDDGRGRLGPVKGPGLDLQLDVVGWLAVLLNMDRWDIMS